jgi:transcriptional regulator with XRE-family HTH domain
MGRSNKRRVGHLLREARYALGVSQAEFGPALGASPRTVVQWEHHRSLPSGAQLRELAGLLLPVDRDRAAEAAHFAGGTLESLGLVVRAPGPAPAAPAPAPRVPAAVLVDAVLCHAADASDLLPSALRPILLATLAQARALDLTLEQLEEGLRVRVPDKAGAKAAPPRRVRVTSADTHEEEDASPGTSARRHARV